MLAAHLKQILANRAQVSRTSGGSMILREKQVMKVELAETPTGLTAIDMRKIGSFSGINEGEWKQRCDYLLVYEYKGENIAIFVELKKTLSQEDRRGMEQLRRSLPLLQYLHSVCRIHHGVEPDEPIATARYFLIGEKMNPRLDKQPVKPGRLIASEDYEEITVNTFIGPRLRFDVLQSK